MPAKFVIRPNDIYFGFTFEGDNENLILFSRLYRSKSLCYTGIKEFKQVTNSNERFEKMVDKYNQYSFTVKNRKNMMIGHSKTFYASSTRDYAIKQIMREATSAIITEAGTYSESDIIIQSTF